MQAFSAGTLAGAGSFRCDSCGFAVALHERDPVPGCPECGGHSFRRASLFGDDAPGPDHHQIDEPPDWLEEARESLVESGDYLAFEDDERVRVVPLQEGWTRVGRSLSAHIRFDDRILDDRSLNGVFRNGERVELAELEDGDVIDVGRFSMFFMSFVSDRTAVAG